MEWIISTGYSLEEGRIDLENYFGGLNGYGRSISKFRLKKIFVEFKSNSNRKKSN